MTSERAAGILLHPTSLPGRFGIGDLGPGAERFLDWAQAGGQSWWQFLPLGPPERGNSPYTALSAFAGNPLLISPEILHRQGLLEARDLDAAPGFPEGRVDFERAVPWKEALLRRSWDLFRGSATPTLHAALREFIEAPEQAGWLDDWALFAALRVHHHGRGWWQWPRALADRDAGALADVRRDLAGEIDFQRYLQFQFTSQWRQVATAARRRGVRLLGDLPIYVSLDSADVWTRREYFDLDARGHPRAVAGVPPDYFSEDGQWWGHPLYRWDRMADDGFAWWVERLAANLRHCSALRLDHFRGYEACWRIPADAENAAAGAWSKGPGRTLFEALRTALGRLPLVAEDLGVIGPEVEALRREIGLPGMKVLQFAFGDEDSEHLPHRFEPACVAYTGTHDNDTTAGWHRSLGADARARLCRYAGIDDTDDVSWALIRLAYVSVADVAIVPVQDVLSLGSEARMNVPSVAEGNWAWRLRSSQLSPDLALRLRSLAEVSGRS